MYRYGISLKVFECLDTSSVSTVNEWDITLVEHRKRYDDFQKISDHFLKISKDSSKIGQRPHKHLKTSKKLINKAQFETEEKLNWL